MTASWSAKEEAGTAVTTNRVSRIGGQQMQGMTAPNSQSA